MPKKPANPEKPKTKLLEQVASLQVAPRNVRRPGKKSKAWDQDPEILARLESVSQMMLRGAKTFQISLALDCSIDTVQRDRQRVKELWQREAAGNVNENRVASITHLRHIQTTAYQQYEKTKDAALLRLVRDCERDIVALEGTETPVDQTLNIQQNARPLESLSDGELFALYKTRQAGQSARPAREAG